jgi:hypothetical protein
MPGLITPPDDNAGPGRDALTLDARIRRLEQIQAAILRSLNGTTMTITCNEDATITGEVTFPDLPSS